jgi:general stress protein YciG
MESIAAQGGDARAKKLSPARKSAIAKKGGKVGGKARASALTPERRAEIARKAAAARWGKKD